MPGFLFRNRWIAFVWAMGVLASIGVFFSDGGGQEELVRATETIRENAAFTSSQQEPEAIFLDEAEEPVFTEEEEPATGTLRPGEASADGEEDEAETYVILDPQAVIAEGEDF